jgi:ATP-dependent RNA helicase DHX37/DHR1
LPQGCSLYKQGKQPGKAIPPHLRNLGLDENGNRISPSDDESDFDSSESSNDSQDEEVGDSSDDGTGESEGSDEEVDGDDDSEDEDGGDEGDSSGETPKKKKDFAAWANQQMAQAEGIELSKTGGEGSDPPAASTSGSTTPAKPRKPPPKREGPAFGPLGEVLQIPSSSLLLPSQRAFFVSVDRSPEVQEARTALPIIAEEETIMDAIRHHSVIVICGETGSGKTTQVPQFLYEAGWGSKGSGGSLF